MAGTAINISTQSQAPDRAAGQAGFAWTDTTGTTTYNMILKMEESGDDDVEWKALTMQEAYSISESPFAANVYLTDYDSGSGILVDVNR